MNIEKSPLNIKRMGLWAGSGDVGKTHLFKYIIRMSISFLPKNFLLPRYILKALIGPFVFSFSTLMFLFLLQFVMKFIDQLIGKGLTPWIIIELIALNLAWMVVLAVPMSVLVATLMAFGEMSSLNEVTAMKASGVSILRMIAPVMITATILAALLVLFFNEVLPDANHRAKTLGMDIRRKKPTLSLSAGLFSQDISGYSILVRKTFEKTNDLEGITLYDYTNPGTNVVITASRGAISFSPDYRKLIMDLHDGEIHTLDLQDMTEYRRIRFVDHRIAMDVEGFDFERTEGSFIRSDRELSAEDMLAIVDSLRAESDTIAQALRRTVDRDMQSLLTGKEIATPVPEYRGASRPIAPPALTHARQMNSLVVNDLIRMETLGVQINQYMVEVHKKYSIPAACMVFVLVGIPLGIMAKKGGFGVAATLSLGFFLLYWSCLIGGEKLADRGFLSPAVGMWAANVIIGALGIYLVIRIGREALVIHWEFFKRFVPKRWRTDLADDPKNMPELP
ncbi:MAG: LptF/LptG family permease [Bacteroidota bacterium]